jgi:hypothetical protein
MENLQQNIPLFLVPPEFTTPKEKKKLSVGGGSSLNGRGGAKIPEFCLFIMEAFLP